jgi:hypothetical protein
MKNKILLYNTKKMEIVKSIPNWIIILSIILFIFIGVILGYINGFKENKQTVINNLSMEDKLVVVDHFNEFNEYKFVDLVIKLNIKHPEIVISQALHETAEFRSKIFIENNNLFGMKEASSRNNTAAGTQYNHAYYDSWIDSVVDYALWQSSYTKNIPDDIEYLKTISVSYAEDPEYVNKVKKYIPKAKELLSQSKLITKK